MKQALDRFIRSLAERELAQTAPETLQDLGTFVDWLLERLGYTVHLRAFKYAGLQREKSSGRLQLGVDTLATKRNDAGQLELYRFVLKAGSITKGDWGRSGDEGNIVHDVRLASERNLDRDYQDFVLGDEVPSVVVVVAVHNGDFDAEALGGSRAQLKSELAKRDIQLAWWDADDLVQLAEPLLATGPHGEQSGDAGLFPPAVRPFARLALDSIRRDWRAFDFRAVDEYIEGRLPLGRIIRRTESAELLEPGKPMDAKSLYRRASEVPLFTAMLIAESRVTGQTSTLPALDTIERCICRLAEHGQRLDLNEKKHLSQLRAPLVSLLQQYVELAQTLRARLELLRDVRFGLAIASLSEPVDYPLRCTRLLGYLAVAGLALIQTGDGEGARAFADTISAIWTSNDAACESPVTDDQVIELTAVWSLLLKLGIADRVGSMTTSLINRLAARRCLPLPLPALYQNASVPIAERDQRVLATAYVFGRDATAQFVDDASTLLTIATYLAYQHGSIEQDTIKLLHEGARDDQGNELSPRCSFQLWRPPEDAACEWYAHEIAYRGICHQFANAEQRDHFVQELEAQATPVHDSFARVIELEVIDFIAWKRWRTPPAPHVIVRLSTEKTG